MDRADPERFSDAAGARAKTDGSASRPAEQRHVDRFAELRRGRDPDPDAARAERMGAVAFLRLRKDDLVKAVEEHPSVRSVGSIIRFPRQTARPAPPSFEDPRWAELHKPE